jgi:hypothetical protein
LGKSSLGKSGLDKSAFGKSRLGKSGLRKSGLSGSSFGKSGLNDPLAGPDWDELGPPGPWGERNGLLGRSAPLVDASGGGCGGKPAAIRWRKLDASGRAGSEPLDVAD